MRGGSSRSPGHEFLPSSQGPCKGCERELVHRGDRCLKQDGTANQALPQASTLAPPARPRCLRPLLHLGLPFLLLHPDSARPPRPARPCCFSFGSTGHFHPLPHLRGPRRRLPASGTHPASTPRSRGHAAVSLSSSAPGTWLGAGHRGGAQARVLLNRMCPSVLRP